MAVGGREVGVDVAAKQVLWVKVRPDIDVLFQLLNNLRSDSTLSEEGGSPLHGGKVYTKSQLSLE